MSVLERYRRGMIELIDVLKATEATCGGSFTLDEASLGMAAWVKERSGAELDSPGGDGVFCLVAFWIDNWLEHGKLKPIEGESPRRYRLAQLDELLTPPSTVH